jgi:hypothetical protein
VYQLRLTILGGSDVDTVVQVQFDLADAHTDEHVAKVARAIREAYRGIYGDRVTAWTLQQVELVRDIDFTDKPESVKKEDALAPIPVRSKAKKTEPPEKGAAR